MEGVLIRPHLDSNGRELAIEHVQDVAPILEWNRRARQEEARIKRLSRPAKLALVASAAHSS